MERKECSNHAGKQKKADCLVCGKSICEDCISFIAGKAYCKSCGYAIISEAEVLYLKRIYKTIKDRRKFNILRDKRRYERIRIVKPIEIYNIQKDKNIRGTIIDISAGDVAVITDEQLFPKDNVKLVFTLSEEYQFKNIQGGVVRVEKVGDKYYSAIIFMNLGENKEKLEDFVVGRLKKKYMKEGIGYV